MSERFAYARFHVRAPDNPKVAALSDRDYRAWTEMFLYCADNLTDGFIPERVAKERWRRSVPGILRQHLLAGTDSGYTLHDYLDWNDSKAVVEARREQARRAGQKSGTNRSTDSSTPSSTVGSTDGSTESPTDAGGSVEPTRTRTNTKTFSSTNTKKSLAPSPSANGRGKLSEEERGERVALKNALVACCGYDPKYMTSAVWGRVESAAKDLHGIEAHPDDVSGFPKWWRREYPRATLTPQAVVNNWPDYAKAVAKT